MNGTKIKHFCFVVFALLAAHPQLIYSQWVSDSTTNVAVCRANGNQQLPQICSDGNDGAIIVWQDYRSAARYDVYAQLINKNGVRQWAENGILISNGANKAINPVICPDGSGGAYIVWEDYRTSANGADLYSQHVTSSGTLTHAAGGSKISVKRGDQLKAKICFNGDSCAFVVYEDHSPYIAPQTSRPDLGMNFLSPSRPHWSDSGDLMITASLRQTEPCIVDDGAGGCFIGWESSAGPPNGIFASRVSRNGTVLWGFTAQGILIHRGANDNMNSRFPKVTRDGNEFIMAWEEAQYNFTTHGYDVLCQRIRSDSSKKWFSSATLTPQSPGDQIEVVPFTDNNGGALVAYTNFFGNKDIAVTHVWSDGVTVRPQPNTSYPVCNVANDQYGAVGLKTPNGIFLVWNDERVATGQSAIYVNRVDTTPTRQLFPSGSSSASRWGVPISKAPNVNKDQVVMTGRENGAIIAWRDTRNSATAQDLYCQLVFFNGTLPIELTSFDVRALSQGAVRIDWKTAMEKDNAGFEIERRNISDPHSSNMFDVVASYNQFGSLKGLSNSNHERNYSFVDVPNAAGIYEYRLVDVSLDGERTLHQIKQVETSYGQTADSWSVEQNYPNPFNDATNIVFEMPQAAVVDLQVFDALGRNYNSSFASELLEKGFHSITIRSSELAAPAGTYYYMLTARNAETGDVIWKMPKAGMMVKITN